MQSLNVSHLIHRAQHGDRDAVAKLYHAHVQPIYRYISYRVPNGAADDLTAEVFLRMVEGLSSYVQNGAPFEVFLSADADRPRRLEDSGAAVAGTRFTYAIGRLALWCPGLEGCSEDESILASDRFRHLAIADPEIAPYGRAARQLLVTRGLWERLQGRLVIGASVAQAHQFVASGAAEVGLVALAQVLTEEPPTSWRSVPAGMHSPIEQQAVLLRPGRDRAAALAFLEFLAGAEARGVIRDFGYDTSEP